MLKKSKISKILLVGIFTSLLLLILVGTVNADETQKWGYTGATFNNKENKTYEGENNGVKWEARIIKKNASNEAGTASIRITNSNGIENIVLGDQFYRKKIKEYTYDIITLENNAFSGAKNAKSIDIGKYVKNIDTSCFVELNSLEKITIDSENENFISEDGVLYNKDKTVLVKFPNNKSLENFEFPKTVTSIGEYAFCGNNTENISLEIPNTITSIGNCAFAQSKIKEITIPDTVTTIGEGVFEHCEALTKVTLPTNLNTISTNLFSNCTKLASIEIPASVTNIESGAFESCKSLKKVKLPSELTEIKDSIFNMCTELKSIELSNKIEKIGNNAFASCAIENIDLPETLKSIGEKAFYGTSLKNVEIPLSTSSIGKSAFAECKKLKNIVFSKQTADIGSDAFLNCDKDLVIYCYNYGEQQINNLISLYNKKPAYVLCGGVDNDNDNTPEYVKITKVSQGDTCTEIKLLKEIYGLKIQELGTGAFKGNSNLQKISLTENITVLGNEIFADCKSLNNVILPKSITSIPDNAFKNCSSLSKLVIRTGSNIETIGKDAFLGCHSSLNVYHDGNNSKINEYAKGRSNFVIDNLRPTLTVGSRLNDNKTSVTVTLTNIKDNEGGSGTYYYAISLKDKVEEVPEEEWQEVTSDKIIKDVYKNGTYYIYVCDMVGNTGKPVTKKIEGIDETAPTIAEQYNSISYSREGANISINVKEETSGSGLNSYAFSKETDVGNIENWKTISGYEYEIKDMIPENGTWYLYVKDNAGNISAGKQIEITKVDKEKPKIGDFDISYSDKDVTITVTVTDAGGSHLGAYAIDLSKETNDKTKWILINKNLDEFEIKHTIEANGTYYLHVKDQFENTNTSAAQEITNLVDKIAPRISVGEMTSDKKVKITITDAYSGIASGASIGYAWTPNNSKPSTSAFKSAKLQYQEGVKEYTFEIEGPGKVEGTYYLWLNVYELYDVAENGVSGEQKSYPFVLDMKSPTILSATVFPEVIKEGTSATVTYVLSESINEIPEGGKPTVKDNTLVEITEFKYNKGENKLVLTLIGKSGSGTAEIIIPKGIIVDTSGNTMEKDYSITVTVNNEAPDLSKQTIISNPIIKKDQETTFTINAEEKLTLNNNKVKDIKLVDKNNNSLGTIKEIKTSDDGKTWTITVIGDSGNGDAILKLPEGLFTNDIGNSSAEQSYEGLKIDNTCPVLTIEGESITVNKEKTVIFAIKSNEAIKINDEGKVEIKAIDSSKTVTANVEVTKKDEVGKEWKVTITNCTGDGAAKLVVPAGYFVDEAGNKCSFIEKECLTVDNTLPNFTISEPTLNQAKNGAIITVTFEELENGLKYAFTASKQYTQNSLKSVENKEITLEASENGTYYFHIEDSAGNKKTEMVKVNCNIDTTAPTANVEYKAVQNGIQVKITANEQIQEVEGWEINNNNTIISKVFTENNNSQITIKDISGNETKVPVNVKLVTSIKLNKTEIKLKISEKEKLVATIEPNDATIKNITFKSNDESIAKVSSEGNVTAIKEGETKIVVTTEQGNKIAECVVKVIKQDQPEEKLSIELKNESKYEITTENEVSYIEKISPKTTIQTVLDSIKTNGEIKIYKGTNEVTDKTQKIATGMTIEITKGTEKKTYTIVVTGDTNGDGEANMSDILQINKHRLGKVLLTGANLKAGNVNGDEKVDISDILKINKYRLGKDTL